MRIIMFFVGIALWQNASAQTFTEKFTKELVFGKPSGDNVFILSNINGAIKVTGYDGDKIVLEVAKTIHAKTPERLERGKAEVQLGVMDRADTIILYITDGCHEFRRRSGRNAHARSEWGYQSIHQQDCNPPYDYRMDFTLKVPSTLNLILNTINEGDVVVENVSGIIMAGNINGSIRLEDLRSAAEAHTINGDVDVLYDRNPQSECRFYTLNGDINAMFKPGLSANLTFESFNGSFYTNIDRLETLPQKVVKTSRADGVQYKITDNQFKVGNGGPLLEFETFNGNVYLKESTQ